MIPGTYELLLYRDDEVSVAKDLMAHCALETEEATADAKGVLLAFLKRAEQGLLIHEDDDKDVTHCASQPDIWELYPLGSDTLIRAYHGEPVEEPYTLVVTHSHEKWIGGSKEEIQDAQNVEMETAQDLFESGRGTRWGYDPVQAARRDLDGQ